jgi:hypothetical protein
MANHTSTQTAQLYDRRSDEMSLDELFWSRWRRSWASASTVLAAGLSAAGVLTVVKELKDLSETGKATWSPWLIVGGVITAAILMAFRARSKYLQRTYDPKWINKFNEQFLDQESMIKSRRLAAKTLMEYEGRLDSGDKQLDSIDDVLDFFEELGFYVKGDQVSPEFAHQSLFNWIEGYYTAAESYIRYEQTITPTSWDHIEYLYVVTKQVEEEISKKKVDKLNSAELMTFLDNECEDRDDHQVSKATMKLRASKTWPHRASWRACRVAGSSRVVLNASDRSLFYRGRCRASW